LHWFPVHVWPPVQLPQLATVLGEPQLSVAESEPQDALRRVQNAVSLSGVHGPLPQTLSLPPAPQVCPPEHDPQESVPPQPSERLPQFLPRAAHVVGTQPRGPSVVLASAVEPLSPTPESVSLSVLPESSSVPAPESAPPPGPLVTEVTVQPTPTTSARVPMPMAIL
jgi:hypothetical protein